MVSHAEAAPQAHGEGQFPSLSLRHNKVTSKHLSIQDKLFLPLQTIEENSKALSKLLLEVIEDLKQCQKIWNKLFST